MKTTDEQKLNNLKKRQYRQNEYVKRKYDRISIVLPKGYKELISSSGATLNGFITDAVNAELKRRGLLTEDNNSCSGFVPDTNNIASEDPEEFPFN